MGFDRVKPTEQADKPASAAVDHMHHEVQAERVKISGLSSSDKASSAGGSAEPGHLDFSQPVKAGDTGSQSGFPGKDVTKDAAGQQGLPSSEVAKPSSSDKQSRVGTEGVSPQVADARNAKTDDTQKASTSDSVKHWSSSPMKGAPGTEDTVPPIGSGGKDTVSKSEKTGLSSDTTQWTSSPIKGGPDSAAAGGIRRPEFHGFTSNVKVDFPRGYDLGVK